MCNSEYQAILSCTVKVYAMKRWFKCLFKFKRKDESYTTKITNPEITGKNSQISSVEIDYYVSDSPISDPDSEDKLKRWPFAQRIAQTIASRRDPSSIVIGICGAWGEGKTSVLNFIEKELKNWSHVICIRFNPWRFTNEAHLLQSFFQTLADALGQSISSKKKEIGDALQKYGAVLSGFSLNAGIIQVSPGQIAKELGATLSSIELVEIRDRIEDILKDEGKRVVILMDDIDRLDKTEVQTIFKLVKLSADFAYTAYILAYEPEMVAASLGEKYSSGDKEAGFRFLEKIVQIPLNIPSADQLSLRKICFGGVDRALKETNIELSQEQVQAFVRHFTIGLEIRLKTPRIGKRYGNALTFSLPILKGEVNPGDLMLVEGIRVFYPKLYEVVKENAKVFLGTILDTPNKEQAKKHSLEVINKGLEGLNEVETEAAKDLLQELFPRLKGILSNVTYGPDWDERWAKEQRVSSRQYFSRYFSYAIPEGDISDQELEHLIERSKKESLSVIASEMRQLIGDRSADTFILKLRQRAKALPSDISRNLSLAIAGTGDIFPKPEILYSFSTPFSQAGILVHQLVNNIPKSEGRFDITKEIVIKGEPISFAVECFRWLRTSEEKEEQDRTLTVEEEEELGKIIVERIKVLSAKRPIFIQFPEDTQILFYIWSRYGSKGETHQYLTKLFNKDPHNALEYIKCYLGTSWGVESGLSHKGDFERHQYDSVKEVVDIDIIYDALYKKYGSVLDNPDYSEASNYPLDERVARQFAYIHHKVKTEGQAKVQEIKSEDDNTQNDGD